MTTNTIHYSIVEGMGHLMLNQPPSNKMTLDFFLEFNEMIATIGKSNEIRALVISGKGRHFSSGADLSALLKEIHLKSKVGLNGEITLEPGFLTENYNAFLALDQLNIPVIAAIRGVCLGSALELALFSHFRFSSEEAVFGLPETSFNLIPGLGGITKVASLSGKANTIELVLKGKTFTAFDALKLNLIDRILPKKEFLHQSFSFAGSIAGDYHKEKRKLYLRNYFTA